jgi:integrase
MPERYEAMVWVAALTGLRWGEVAGLTVGQLNLVDPFTITVDRQVGRDEHGRPVVEDPKSEAGTRTLSIPIALRAVLAEHLARTGLTAADGDRLLFAAADGGLLRYSDWRRDAWVPAALAAGFSRERADARRPGRTRTEPTIGFHDLRRMNATEMIRLQVDVKTAQHRLGHADPRLTLALYADATTEADLEAADRLGGRLLASNAEAVGTNPITSTSSGTVPLRGDLPLVVPMFRNYTCMTWERPPPLCCLCSDLQRSCNSSVQYSRARRPSR